MRLRIVIHAEVEVDEEILKENGEWDEKIPIRRYLNSHLSLQAFDGSALSCAEEAIEVCETEVQDVSLISS
jgi:HEPN domain-containing protein